MAGLAGRPEMGGVERLVQTLALAVERCARETQARRQAFQAVTACVEQLNGLQKDCLFLDVGGIKYHTSRQVFTRGTTTDTFLPTLFEHEPHWGEDGSGDDGYTFFDCDSAWFSNVLSYLRQGTPSSPLLGTTPSPAESPNSVPGLNYYGWDTLYRRAQQKSVVMVAGGDDILFDTTPQLHQVYNAVERWADGAWAKLPPMLQRRFGATAIVFRGRLVVTGGFDGTRYLDSAEEFDPDAGLWRPLPAMASPRAEHAAADVGQRLVVAGGVTAGGLSRLVEEYDPAAQAWRSLAPLPSGRAQCAACVVDGRVVVIGGENDANNPLGLAEELVPSTGEWRRLPSLLRKRAFCTAAVVDGRVVVDGGFDEDGNELFGAEELDPKAWKWHLVRGPGLPHFSDAAYSVEAQVLLRGDGAEDVALTETLHVGSAGTAVRAYATYEMLTVPGSRAERGSVNSPETRSAAQKAKKHPPVVETKLVPRNRIMITH